MAITSILVFLQLLDICPSEHFASCKQMSHEEIAVGTWAVLVLLQINSPKICKIDSVNKEITSLYNTHLVYNSLSGGLVSQGLYMSRVTEVGMMLSQSQQGTWNHTQAMK